MNNYIDRTIVGHAVEKSGRKSLGFLGKDVFRCQGRNSGITAGSISFSSLGKSFVTRARVD